MTDEVERDEFSVYVFQPDGTYSRGLSFVSSERAVRHAMSVSQGRYAWQYGEVEKVIITDGGDFTVFVWQRGEGVTFPPRSAT